uniref:HDC07383 n=1 Tax=Drosophila melanogaster TaxID=7227 RepID=Q6IG34_DROME|nr:TPA_inf: HDC07383 [Drosophila melanogaster]
MYRTEWGWHVEEHGLLPMEMLLLHPHNPEEDTSSCHASNSAPMSFTTCSGYVPPY